MRTLIFILLFYLTYRAVKSWILNNFSIEKNGQNKQQGQIDDIMIKDPFCGVYFPKRNGVHLRINGQNLYFCSSECKEKYLAEQGKS